MVAGSRLKCIFPGCKSSSSESDIDISFHRFPKKPEQRTNWLASCDFAEKNVLPTSAICSKHFLPGDFKIGANKKRYLNKGVYPTRNIDIQENVDPFDFLTTQQAIQEIMSPVDNIFGKKKNKGNCADQGNA